ncbi:MAG: universal stress protein [Actinomycetota bacterium]
MRERRIVVGVDGSPGSLQALNWAIDLARDLEAEIIAVLALDLPLGLPPQAIPSPFWDRSWRDEMEGTFELDWCAPLREAGVKYRTVMQDGAPATVIAETAQREQADMIVAGARGRGSVTELVLGSVSHRLVHHSPCPVVVVHPPTR